MKAYTNMAHSWTASTVDIEFENTGFLFEDGKQEFAGAVAKRKFKINLYKSMRQVPTDENSANRLCFLMMMGLRVGSTFLAKIHEMPFNTEQFLPGNMEVNGQFFRSKKETSIKGIQLAYFNVHITKFQLVVAHAQVRSDVYNDLEKKIVRDKLEIPVIRTIVTNHTLNQNQTPQT